MRIDIVTLFPEFFDTLKTHSIVGRALANKKIELVTHNMRDWSHDAYKTVDDHPYGGGVGMVLKVDVVAPAIADVRKENPEAPVLLTTPQGVPYSQHVARTLSSKSGLIIVCGHYEGYDERIRDYVDLEISVGDFVLTGGEIPAMAIVDSVARLLPGVLGHDESSQDESFSEGLLEYPQYTRPPEYDNKKVPEILLGGNHKEIQQWRTQESKLRTKSRRPDL